MCIHGQDLFISFTTFFGLYSDVHLAILKRINDML